MDMSARLHLYVMVLSLTINCGFAIEHLCCDDSQCAYGSNLFCNITQGDHRRNCDSDEKLNHERFRRKTYHAPTTGSSTAAPDSSTARKWTEFPTSSVQVHTFTLLPTAVTVEAFGSSTTAEPNNPTARILKELPTSSVPEMTLSTQYSNSPKGTTVEAFGSSTTHEPSGECTCKPGFRLAAGSCIRDYMWFCHVLKCTSMEGGCVPRESAVIMPGPEGRDFYCTTKSKTDFCRTVSTRNDDGSVTEDANCAVNCVPTRTPDRIVHCCQGHDFCNGNIPLPVWPRRLEGGSSINVFSLHGMVLVLAFQSCFMY